MDREVVLAVIAILPQLVFVGLAVAFAVRFRQPVARLLEERVSSVSAFGVKVDLRPAEVEAAVKDRIGHEAEGPTGQIATNELAPIAAGEQVVERAKRLASRLAGRTILWVDDHPEGSRVERRMLRQMGIFTEAAATNAQSMAVLDDPAETIDLIISDIGRDDGSPAGPELIEALRGRSSRPPIVLYVGRLDRGRGTPAGAFGITNRPDELLNLVMDALDR
jgi:CheY-like chemotaxis protein